MKHSLSWTFCLLSTVLRVTRKDFGTSEILIENKIITNVYIFSGPDTKLQAWWLVVPSKLYNLWWSHMQSSTETRHTVLSIMSNLEQVNWVQIPHVSFPFPAWNFRLFLRHAWLLCLPVIGFFEKASAEHVPQLQSILNWWIKPSLQPWTAGLVKFSALQKSVTTSNSNAHPPHTKSR